MIRFEDIQERAEESRSDADVDLLRRAYVFSAMVHRGQLRKSGEPYLTHPLAVAYILADLELDEASIATGLLHDTVEDSKEPDRTRAELQEKFGEEILNLVEGVTKLKQIDFASEADRQAENLRKMMLAMGGDVRVVLVKLADRLHNMRTLSHVPPDKQKRISSETSEIYVPLANRLGIGEIREELEDLALRYGEPDVYSRLERHLRSRAEVIDRMIIDVREELDKHIKDHNIPAEITGRVKSIPSIRRKMLEQGIDVSKVFDIVAFRVITPTVRDCYGALGIIHAIWPPVPGRIKDYIAIPKPNLYRSLHTTVMSKAGYPFEVQIRTPEMHRVAELGIAAHWRYKEKDQVSEQELAGVEWLRQLLEWQKDVRDSREFMRYVKIDLFQEEVHVFTPKGKVISLPKGSTPVDFAYAIHTEVGHQCVGARIGGRLVPLRTELRNGDIVEIVTQTGHAPSRDWLGIVRTGRARHKIRSYLRKVERERSIEIGRSMLERESRRSSVSLRSISDEAKQEALEKLKLNSMDDLHAQVGLGKVSPGQYLELVAPERVKEQESEADHTSLLKRMTGAFKRDHGKVLVHGFGDTMISLAGCCNPIPGDAIVGYITRGRGVSVHKEDCSNLEGLLQADPDREIAVAWAAETEKNRFDVGLRILTENRPGRLARVASLLENEKINIRHADAEVSDDGRGTIWVVAEVENRRQVDRLVDRIRKIDGVYHVERAAPHSAHHGRSR